MKKLKIISIAICCLFFVLLSKIQCMENALDKFHQECIVQRAISIKTERAVITPTFPEDLKLIEKMYADKQTNFIQKIDFNEEKNLKTIAYTQLSNEIRAGLKIVVYSIFILNEDNKISFSGLYDINNPDEEGWSSISFILHPEYRSRGLGTEIKMSIYNNLIKNLVGKKVKTLFYYDNIIEVKGVQYFESFDAETEDSNIEFKGLQGWVHENNGASIKVLENCGWCKSGCKSDFDFQGNVGNFILYRSPSI
ncbi:MAG: GNAT family N-acetyltransferase [Candidatus Paracaedibacter sp.]